jgi:hypothetical protein
MSYAMDTMYAMQRANGDWFAFANQGRLRVPVFHSDRAAITARSRNSGMMLFKPMALDARALANLISTTESDVCFWLVDDPSIKLSHGRELEHAQMALLVSDSAPSKGRGMKGE